MKKSAKKFHPKSAPSHQPVIAEKTSKELSRTSDGAQADESLTSDDHARFASRLAKEATERFRNSEWLKDGPNQADRVIAYSQAKVLAAIATAHAQAALALQGERK